MGAGVIGLAIARELAIVGKDVLVLEQGPRFGEGVSSRNSEVIHAGIYYPAGSLKAELCVRGKSLLYEYCESRSIGHHRIGKLIVATTAAEEEQLADIKRQAGNNGVDDLVEVSRQRVAEMEPALNATMALFSPSTGIISAPELMTSLLADLESFCDNLPRSAYSQFTKHSTSNDWFEVYQFEHNVWAIYEPFQWQEVISYLIIGSNKALLVDSGNGIGDIKAIVNRLMHVIHIGLVANTDLGRDAIERVVQRVVGDDRLYEQRVRQDDLFVV